jgi:hypothetical protein
MDVGCPAVRVYCAPPAASVELKLLARFQIEPIEGALVYSPVGAPEAQPDVAHGQTVGI